MKDISDNPRYRRQNLNIEDNLPISREISRYHSDIGKTSRYQIKCLDIDNRRINRFKSFTDKRNTRKVLPALQAEQDFHTPPQPTEVH